MLIKIVLMDHKMDSPLSEGSGSWNKTSMPEFVRGLQIAFGIQVIYQEKKDKLSQFPNLLTPETCYCDMC